MGGWQELQYVIQSCQHATKYNASDTRLNQGCSESKVRFKPNTSMVFLIKWRIDMEEEAKQFPETKTIPFFFNTLHSTYSKEWRI